MIRVLGVLRPIRASALCLLVNHYTALGTDGRLLTADYQSVANFTTNYQIPTTKYLTGAKPNDLTTASPHEATAK
jgi:hypothetical protein